MVSTYTYMRVFAAVHGISVWETRKLFKSAGIIEVIREFRGGFDHDGYEKSIQNFRKRIELKGFECPERVIPKLTSDMDVRFPFF